MLANVSPRVGRNDIAVTMDQEGSFFTNWDLYGWVLKIKGFDPVNKNKKWNTTLNWQAHISGIGKLINYSGTNDALFAAAIARWQSKNGISVDGILGPKTWAKLKLRIGGNSSFVGRWNNATWDSYALKAVTNYGPNLTSITPKDIKDFCPNYPSFDLKKRKLFWVYLISCMAQRESGFKPLKKYTESFKDRMGKNVISRGLLQMSIASAKQERYANIELKKAADLHNPELNIRAGVRILNYWMGRDHKISGKILKPNGKFRYLGGGRYWAVLRSRSKSFNVIKNWVKNSKLCAGSSINIITNKNLPKGNYARPSRRARIGEIDPRIVTLTSNWVWPVEKEPRAPGRNPVISDGYHIRGKGGPKPRWHNGADIMYKRSYRIARGSGKKNHQTPLFDMWAGVKALAVGPGTVVITGQLTNGKGGRVRIDHGNNLVTAYLHLDKIFVKEGQQVNVGDVIGLVGGGRGLYHMHFELWYGNASKVLDPGPYLRRWRVLDT